MGITGYKTRAVFDRYNIVSADDLSAGLDAVGAYLDMATATKVEALQQPDSDKVCESDAVSYALSNRRRT